VSYEVRFEVSALRQMMGLPEVAFDALVARVTNLADEPWDAWPVTAAEGSSEFRRTQFGEHGLLSFVADEAAQQIRIFDVLWAG
jgi:hypothetical protein